MAALGRALGISGGSHRQIGKAPAGTERQLAHGHAVEHVAANQIGVPRAFAHRLAHHDVAVHAKTRLVAAQQRGQLGEPVDAAAATHAAQHVAHRGLSGLRTGDAVGIAQWLAVGAPHIAKVAGRAAEGRQARALHHPGHERRRPGRVQHECAACGQRRIALGTVAGASLPEQATAAPVLDHPLPRRLAVGQPFALGLADRHDTDATVGFDEGPVPEAVFLAGRRGDAAAHILRVGRGQAHARIGRAGRQHRQAGEQQAQHDQTQQGHTSERRGSDSGRATRPHQRDASTQAWRPRGGAVHTARPRPAGLRADAQPAQNAA